MTALHGLSLQDPAILLTIAMMIYYICHIEFPKRRHDRFLPFYLSILVALCVGIIPLLYYGYALILKLDIEQVLPQLAGTMPDASWALLLWLAG